MGWYAGENVNTGQLITAAQWNNYLGADGSLDYLKVQTDRLDLVDQDQPSRALDTIYQNITRLRVVLVTVHLDPNDGVYVYVGAASPPDILIDRLRNDNTNVDALISMSSTFIVKPSHYYKVTTIEGAPSIFTWTEWDLF